MVDNDTNDWPVLKLEASTRGKHTVLDVYLSVITEAIERYIYIGYSIEWYKGNNYERHSRYSGKYSV